MKIKMPGATSTPGHQKSRAVISNFKTQLKIEAIDLS